MKVKAACWAFVCSLMLFAGTTRADVDKNIQTMTEAARQLSWEVWEGDNHAYFLVKQETFIAPVAVVFGYADNAAACEALARALSQPQARAGTFKCQPIF